MSDELCSRCGLRPAELRAVPAHLRMRVMPDGRRVGPNESVVRYAPEEDVVICTPCFDAAVGEFATAFDLATPRPPAGPATGRTPGTGGTG